MELKEAERRERWRQRKMLSLVDELGLDRPGKAGGFCSDGAGCAPSQRMQETAPTPCPALTRLGLCCPRNLRHSQINLGPP